jgi:SAM-dependent methyltransferase
VTDEDAMTSRPGADARWSAALAAWAVPARILAAAVEDPWSFPTELFQRRADAALGVIGTPSARIAADALATDGSVLDVGAGGGAAGLALAGRLRRLTAVDVSQAALAGLTARASAAAISTSTVLGSWPEVASDVGAHDVVVCHHVAYNVPSLAAFVRALDDRALRRVVLELTERHPMHALNPLWHRFHGVVRPEGPTALDAVEVIAELGISPRVERWLPESDPDPMPFEARVSLARRRLCLPPGREPEVAAALAELPAERVGRVTIWWDSRMPERLRTVTRCGEGARFG